MPTVTDANLVLGRLPQHHFLGGEIELDMIAACREMERRIGTPLGLDLIEAASGVIEVINTKMAYAVRAITVERGLDPKDFVLLPFGGAGPMHACAIARLLRIPEIVVPVGPVAFSAYGMLVSDMRHDFVRTVVTAVEDRSQYALVDTVFRDMAGEATAVLKSEGVAPRAMRFERSVDMRYVGQEYTVAVPLRHDHFDESVVGDLCRRFHRLHEQTYSHASPGEPTEIVNLRLAAIGIIDRPAIGGIEAGSEEPDRDALIGETEAYFHGAGAALRTQMVRRDRLRAGNRMGGPVIVTEKTATTVVEPGFVMEVMPQGHLILRQEG
jgi:N-methylhydantoinase A